MAYYDALVAKWGTLSSATTNAKLAEINALTVAGPRKPVPIADVMTYLRSNNLWGVIKAAQATNVAAAAAVDLNSDLRMQTIDFGLPIVVAMLAGLVSSGLLTQVQADVLSAMGNSTQPWSQANGYQTITHGDLALAGIQGAMWHYQVTATVGPDSAGATTALVDFWSDAAPSNKETRRVTSITLTDADIASWAFRIARDLATRAALAAQITIGAAQPATV